MSIQEMEDLKQRYLDEMKRLINSEYHDEIKIDELKGNFNSMSIEINKKEMLQQLEQVANLNTYPSKRFNSFCYDDDDEDYTIVITPDFPITDSLIMKNGHLDAISETESDEFIKSSVENLIPIPSESEGIPDNMCDVPFHDNSPPLDVSKDQFEDFFNSNDEFSSTNDDSFSIDNIENVEASPPDSELVSSEVMEIVIPEVGGIDDDILLTIKDDILQISSGSTTTHSDSSLYDSFIFDLSINPFPPADRSDFYEFTDELTHIISPSVYDCFFFKIEPNSRDFTIDVVKDISPIREPRVHNALPTHPTLQVNLDYRVNPRYAIKECSSCGTLYTRDCVCSKGNVKDTILVPKLPKNCARCARCGHPVDGPYCQGCALLRRELEENLVTHSQDFQNTSESSNDSTNIVNAPRGPFVVKQDHKSFVDKIICGLNRAPDSPHLHTISPNQFHFFHCKNVLGDDNIISGLLPCSAITPNEPVLSTEEPDNSLSMGDEHLDTIPATESNEFIKSSVENLIPIPSESEGIPEHKCDVPFHNNSPPIDVSQDQFEDLSESNEEFSSTDEDSFSIDNIDYVEASPPDSELVSSEVMEIVILEVGRIDDDILLTIKDDILDEKLLNVNLLIAKIEALHANPTSSSDCKTKSSSTSLNSLLEETNTFDNSLLEFETFCFNVEEISSGRTTTHSDISLPEYEAFYDDHVKEISSGRTTTHSDISLPEYEAFYDDHVKEISSGSPTTHFDSSLYASFIFDLSINPFPPVDRSDFYEFSDELIPFISPPEYDCFLFKVEPNSRDFTKDVVEDISPTTEPQVHNVFPTYSTLQLNLKFQPSSESLFTYVVWIFLLFLIYSVAPHYLLSLRNEDTIFDLGICNFLFF
nr:hypothetical protein [Tanacetum cinerariifolium]